MGDDEDEMDFQKAPIDPHKVQVNQYERKSHQTVHAERKATIDPVKANMLK